MGGPEVTALHSNKVIQTGTIYKKPQETVNYFMREVPIIYKPVSFCSTHQWIGFYMIGTCVTKEVKEELEQVCNK